MSDVNEPIGSEAENDIAGTDEAVAGTDQSLVDAESDLRVLDGETVEMPAASSTDVLNSGTGNPEEDDAAIDGVPNASKPDLAGASLADDDKDA